MKYWLMTDFHLGHADKMVKYCNRPSNYESLIFDSLSRINEKDCLIFLGDYCIGKDEYWHHSHIQKFQFKKILVKGNHDKKSYNWYLNHGWDFACESFELHIFGKRILFSHIPVIDIGYDLNIHGHFHNSEHRSHEPELLAIANEKHHLIMMEHGYKPFDLQRICNQ